VRSLNQIATLAFFLLLSFGRASLLAQAVCEPVSSPLDKILKPQMDTGFGKMHLNWADEMTGQDLAKEALSEISDRSRVSIGIVDTGFEQPALDKLRASGKLHAAAGLGIKADMHGTGVMNTIMERASSAEITALFTWEEMQSPRQVEAKVNQLKANGTLPKVLNVSFSLGSLDEVHESFEIMAKAGIILVASSGNAGDRALDLNNQRFPGMLIGSSSALGVASEYSQGGPEVDLLAPTDYFLKVNFGARGEVSAKGTSFSAPQVASVISDLLSILPDLTQKEAEEILKRSALRGVASDGGRNGAGILNAYKAVAVAKRLKENAWPLSRSQIFSDSAYDFRSDAEALLQRADASSGERERLLRQSFYLNQKEETRRALVNYYRQPNVKLEPMALFYESLAESSADRLAYLEKQMARADLPSVQKTAIARALIDQKGEDVYMAMLSGADKKDLMASQKKLLEESLKIDSNYSEFAALLLQKQKSRAELVLSSQEIEEGLNGNTTDDRKLSILPLASEDARWKWIRLQSAAKPELAIQALSSVSERPKEFESFELWQSLVRVRQSRSPQLIHDYGFEPSPGIVDRLLFDEPKELQPFLRNWYFARTLEEKSKVIRYLSQLVEEWNLMPEENRKFFLRTKLLATTKEFADSDILAVSAKESLAKLRP